MQLLVHRVGRSRVRTAASFAGVFAARGARTRRLRSRSRAIAFRGTAARAEVVGDAAVLVSVFWVGLAFLALYHVALDRVRARADDDLAAEGDHAEVTALVARRCGCALPSRRDGVDVHAARGRVARRFACRSRATCSGRGRAGRELRGGDVGERHRGRATSTGSTTPATAARPLVTGEARERDLWRLHCWRAGGGCSAQRRRSAWGAVGSRVADRSRSVWRTRCRRSASPTGPGSRRSRSPPPTCWCRTASARSPSGAASAGTDAWLAAALVFLFLARIVLKDYRDRAGDAA